MSERLHFQIRSSDGVTLYDVQAYATANGVRYACNCKAGANNQVCKHRFSLALGETALLASANAHQIAELRALLGPTGIILAIERLKEWEAIAAQVNKNMRDLKGQLVAAMQG